jgi:magnesium transporter
MPELEWVWGYPAALGLMVSVVIAIALWFRHRGWIGGNRE